MMKRGNHVISCMTLIGGELDHTMFVCCACVCVCECVRYACLHIMHVQSVLCANKNAYLLHYNTSSVETLLVSCPIEVVPLVLNAVKDSLFVWKINAAVSYFKHSCLNNMPNIYLVPDPTLAP